MSRQACSLRITGASDLWTSSSHSGKVSMPKFFRHVAKLPADPSARRVCGSSGKTGSRLGIVLVGHQHLLQ